MPDNVATDSAAIVTAVLGAVGMTIGGVVTIAANLNSIFFKPLLEVIKEYLAKSASREAEVATELKAIRDKIDQLPKCPQSQAK